MYNEELAFMLPTSVYTENSALEQQVEKIFRAAPEYLGHEKMAPRLNDQVPLPTTGESCFLVRTETDCKVYVNSCPHRSKKLVTEKTNQKNIRCSAHLFVYDNQGELKKAPKFDTCPNLKLHQVEVSSFHGMLFRTPKQVDLATWFADVPEKVGKLMDMNGYTFCDNMTKHDNIIGGHWIIVMELTDDLLHIPHVHPTLNKLIKIEPVIWEYFNNGFIQTLEFNRPLLFIDEKELQRKFSKPAHATALRYIRVLRNIIKAKPELADDPSLKEIYLASFFPGLQIETLPFLRIVESTRPHTTNTSFQALEYYFMTDVPEEFQNELIDASIDFFTQFDDEDDFLSKDEQEGIEFLARYGIQDRGPVHGTLEAGAQYRHAWIGKKLGLLNHPMM